MEREVNGGWITKGWVAGRNLAKPLLLMRVCPRGHREIALSASAKPGPPAWLNGWAETPKSFRANKNFRAEVSDERSDCTF
jgi:hypothetical protein